MDDLLHYKRENVLFGFLLLNLVSLGDTLKCLSCTSVSRPTDCRYIEECGPSSVCYLDAFVTTDGSYKYKSGCRDELFCDSDIKTNVVIQVATSDIVGRSTVDKSFMICRACCRGDLCNSQGCGQTGYPVPRGPICYSCIQQNNPTDCVTISVCGINQTCGLGLYTPMRDNIYTTGCVPKENCGHNDAPSMPSAAGFDKRNILRTIDTRGFIDPICGSCCHGDLCNNSTCTTGVSISKTVSPTSTFSAVTAIPRPVDGVWSTWSVWSTCPVPCGGSSHSRMRTCTNPLPQNGGQMCPGNSVQSQPCNTMSCSPISTPQSGDDCKDLAFNCQPLFCDRSGYLCRKTCKMCRHNGV